MQNHTTQEVTCTKCYRVVHISPDRVRCEHCGTNLQPILSPDLARTYFYERARQFFDNGEPQLALAEASRGLSQYEDAELRLLAAILARQLGDLDQMRSHVAAIPIDDRLRKEAEWLLRSQYSPERRRERIESMAPTTRGSEPKPAASQKESTINRPVILKLALGVLVSCSLLILVWNVWRQGSQLAFTTPVTPIPNATPIPDATATPQPVATNSETITKGIVQNSGETADGALAANSPEAAVDGSTAFDLAGLLAVLGRNDLAALPVEAWRNDTTLILNGTVGMAEERKQIIEFAQTIEGIAEVNAIGLQVRTPLTYIVQSGDTLWTISYKFYGDDSQRIAQIFEANRNVMNSANDLRVGMEIQLPPME